jgi:hypothetical protein
MTRVAAAATDLAAPVDRVTTVLAGRVDLVTTDQADPADQATTDLAATDLADLVTTDLAAPVTTDLADQATTGPVAPEPTAPADPAHRGTAMTTAGTSTAPRGETDPHPGVPASRRDRPGTGRFRHPVGGGMTGRSTTGATRRPRSGTRSSISSASTSSEFGSRCKESPSRRPLRRLAKRALPVRQ